MVYKCSVRGCRSNYDKTMRLGDSLPVSTFKVPSAWFVDNPELRQRWITGLKRNISETENIKNLRICRLHFRDEDVNEWDIDLRTGEKKKRIRPTLKHGSYPQISPRAPSVMSQLVSQESQSTLEQPGTELALQPRNIMAEDMALHDMIGDYLSFATNVRSRMSEVCLIYGSSFSSERAVWIVEVSTSLYTVVSKVTTFVSPFMDHNHPLSRVALPFHSHTITINSDLKATVTTRQIHFAPANSDSLSYEVAVHVITIVHLTSWSEFLNLMNKFT